MVYIDPKLMYFGLGAIIGYICIVFWNFGGGDNGWAKTIGVLLGGGTITSDILSLFQAIHHSFIGMIVVLSSLSSSQNLPSYELYALIGFGLALIIHHLETEGHI